MYYTLNYILRAGSGKIIDKAENISFQIGDGTFAPALEECIAECEIGRLQTFLLRGEEVFGAYDESAKQFMAKEELPDDIALHSAIDFSLPNGEQIIGVVREITPENALIDFNHPLALIDISFSVTVLSCK